MPSKKPLGQYIKDPPRKKKKKKVRFTASPSSWTKDEEARARSLRAAGKTWREVGEALGRAESTVHQYFQRRRLGEPSPPGHPVGKVGKAVDMLLVVQGPPDQLKAIIQVANALGVRVVMASGMNEAPP